MKSFLEKAVKNRDKSKIYLRENPLDYVKPIKVLNKKPQPILTLEEVNAFLNYMKQQSKFLYELFLTLVYTGMRSGELIHLEWDDINFEEEIIELRQKSIVHVDGTVEKWEPKTMKGKRKIPIHAKLLPVLQERKKGCSGSSHLVFPEKQGGILKRKIIRDFQKAMKHIGREDCTEVHGLRRTFISFMAMKGIPRETTMDIVGHVDEATYELYRHSTNEYLLDCVNKLDF